MKTGSIYLIRNLVDGKVYVGLTAMELYKRWRAHKSAAVSPSRKYVSFLYSAMLAHGIDNFTIEVIETVPVSDLGEAEKKWIAYYSSRDPRKGYNLSSGGDHPIPSELTRKRMSAAQIERNRTQTPSRLGSTASKETRERLSTSLRKFYAANSSPNIGRKHTAEALKKISESSKSRTGANNIQSGRKQTDAQKAPRLAAIRAAYARKRLLKESQAA